MTKACFNCQKNIEKPEKGKCPHCGVEFNLKFYETTADIQNKIDNAINYKRAGEFDKSIKIYEHLNNECPNDPIILKSWAKVLIASGNYDLGLEYLIKAKKLFEFLDYKKDVEIIGVEPERYLVIKDDIRSCEEFIDILINEPRDSGRFLLFLRRVSGNLNYDIDINRINNHVDIFDEKLKQGLFLLNLGKNQEAIEIYDEVLKIEPGHSTALNDKGASLLGLGKYEEAIEVLDEALKNNPKYFNALYNKGVSLIRLGRFIEAVDILDEVLKIDKNDIDTLCHKGAALANLGKYQKALDMFDEALKLNPKNSAALKNKDILLAKLDWINN